LQQAKGFEDGLDAEDEDEEGSDSKSKKMRTDPLIPTDAPFLLLPPPPSDSSLALVTPMAIDEPPSTIAKPHDPVPPPAPQLQQEEEEEESVAMTDEEDEIEVALAPELRAVLASANPLCYICQEPVDFEKSIQVVQESGVKTTDGRVIAEPNEVLCVTCHPPRMAHAICLPESFKVQYFMEYRKSLLEAAESTEGMQFIGLPPLPCSQHQCGRAEVYQSQALSKTAVKTFVDLASGILSSPKARDQHYASKSKTVDNIIGAGLARQCNVDNNTPCWTFKQDAKDQNATVVQIHACSLDRHDMVHVTCAGCKSVTHVHCALLQGRMFPDPQTITATAIPQLFFCPTCLPGVSDHYCANVNCRFKPNGFHKHGTAPLRQDMARSCSKCGRRTCGLCDATMECRECGGEFQEVKWMKKLVAQRRALERRGVAIDHKQEPILALLSTACLVCNRKEANHLFVNDQRCGRFGYLCFNTACEVKWKADVPAYAKFVAERAQRLAINAMSSLTAPLFCLT
jgi:hypothetical protein